MGKNKSSDQTPSPVESDGGRVSVIHLQGPVEEKDWLTVLHKKTHLPKATIVRLALADWAKARGLPPSPVQEASAE